MAQKKISKYYSLEAKLEVNQLQEEEGLLCKEITE